MTAVLGNATLEVSLKIQCLEDGVISPSCARKFKKTRTDRSL